MYEVIVRLTLKGLIDANLLQLAQGRKLHFRTSVVSVFGLVGAFEVKRDGQDPEIGFRVPARTALIMGKTGWTNAGNPTKEQWDSFLEAYASDYAGGLRWGAIWALKKVDFSQVRLCIMYKSPSW